MSVLTLCTRVSGHMCVCVCVCVYVPTFVSACVCVPVYIFPSEGSVSLCAHLPLFIYQQWQRVWHCETDESHLEPLVM